VNQKSRDLLLRCCSSTGPATLRGAGRELFAVLCQSRFHFACDQLEGGHGTKRRIGKKLKWTRIADFVEDVQNVASGFDREPVVIRSLSWRACCD
jgi:hypothetical protein